ncbi:Protein transport protein S9 plasma membrane t-SNARE [Didymosphaeria variabile]|uniref:Protein transport protein SEC9 n=1 Tax=Didymosphaeria variabile TaxID=1932322 RepID=A0A9W8XAY8_9PLEO|nr:Protein transport protein S9 plasma membrane t-SNARE [Didymosphaeria variabile]KAJ4345205.1 Protein transport protein S9 plasma membrane t-SNARE [Didymosphaeria variabile]
MGLFKKKNKEGEAAANPYAAPAKNDPYANAAPPAYSGGNDSFRQEKSPAVTGQGGQFGGRGYQSAGNYGASGGYGGNQFGGGPADQGAPRRTGGYGGMGNADPNNEEERSALFGGAAQRQPKQPQQQPPQESGGYGQQGGGSSYGQSGVSGGGYGAPGGYGSGPAYEDRQLTAEEQEEEDMMATKSEIKFMKQQDVSSTRNALRLAQQAEETGRDTLARLGAQGERIHNTERNLDMASSQNRIAEEKARELKTLNRSMFAVHVANPFTTSSRREERDRKIMENHQNDRAQRDATRAAAWQSTARQDEYKRGTQGGNTGGKSTLADRAKYQFEADSEDDEMENEIDGNLDQLHGAAKRLNALGRAMGQEVDTQNEHIDRITRKTDKVDDQIAMNRARLDRIH